MSQENPVDDGGPAFPIEGWQEIPTKEPSFGTGMTLRDYFAAKTLQGLLANPDSGRDETEEWARVSYKMADAMLKVRSHSAQLAEPDRSQSEGKGER